MEPPGLDGPLGWQEPPDFSSYVVVEHVEPTDQYVAICVGIAAACVLASLAWRLLATALRRRRQLSRSAAPISPPPLGTLSSQLHATAADATPAAAAASQQQAPSTLFSSPFSRSKLILSTSRSPTTPPMQRHVDPAAAIPLLTEINAAPAPPRSPPPPPTGGRSMWTVSKRDVLRRRAHQHQQAEGHAQRPDGAPDVAAEQQQQEQHQQQTHRPAFGRAAAAARAGAAAWSRLRGLCSWGRRQKAGGQEGQQQQQQQQLQRELEQNPNAWPAHLLADSAQHLSHISSLEGLQSSQEYRDWRTVRNQHLDDQVAHKLGAYQALRRADPEAFSALLSRPVILDYDSLPPPRLLLAFEYLATVAATSLALLLLAAPSLPLLLALLPPGPAAEAAAALAAASLAVRLLPLLAWLLLQLWAWAKGHTSAVGRALGMYCVYEDGRYKEHLQVATTMQILLSSLVEATFLGATFLIPGALYSLFHVLLARDPRRRVSFGQGAMRTHAVLERRRVVRVSQYQPASAAGGSPSHCSSLAFAATGGAAGGLGTGEAAVTPMPGGSGVAATPVAGAGGGAVGGGGAAVGLRQLGGMLAAAGAAVGLSHGSLGGLAPSRAGALGPLGPPGSGGSAFEPPGCSSDGYRGGAGCSFSWGAMYSGGTVRCSSQQQRGTGGTILLSSTERQTTGRAGNLFGGQSGANTPASLW